MQSLVSSLAKQVLSLPLSLSFQQCPEIRIVNINLTPPSPLFLSYIGPQRDRILNALYKDERLVSLELVDGFATHAQVLSKMYMQQVLRRSELRAFEEGLAPHQKAVMADGLTIPQRAIIEHNMVLIISLSQNTPNLTCIDFYYPCFLMKPNIQAAAYKIYE